VLTLDEENVDDLLLGACLLSSGSGYRIDRVSELIRRDIYRNGNLRIVECREVEKKGGGVVFSPYLNQIEHVYDVNRCIEKMPDHIRSIYDEDIAGVAAHALDTCDVAFAIHVAAILNVPLIDCDCTGRGLIDYIHNIYFIKNTSLNPVLLLSPDGECTYLHPMTSMLQLVRLCRRYLKTRAPLVVLGSFSKAKNVRRNYLCGTLSKSMKAGRELRKISSEPVATLKSLLKIVRGYLLYRGIVEETSIENVDGSLTGIVKLRGVDSWENSRLIIYVREGTIIAVREHGRPVGMVPDIVTLLSEDYVPITYDNLHYRDKVHVIGIKAPDEWRTSKGLSILGPRYFGIDIDYIPIELLVN